MIVRNSKKAERESDGNGNIVSFENTFNSFSPCSFQKLCRVKILIFRF